MTAPSIKLSDVQFPTSLRGIRIPNRQGVVGEYVFGTSEAESLKNRADPSKPLTISGNGASIVYGSGYAQLKSHATAGYGFLTGLLPNDDATLIFVVRGGGGTQQFMAGIAASWIGFRYFTNLYGANGEGSSAQGANRTAPSSTDVCFHALVRSVKNNQRGTPNGLGKLYWYSSGVQQSSTSANVGTGGPRSAFPGRQIAIGGTTLTDSVTTNPFYAYMFGVIQRPLSAAEIDEVYAATVAYYASVGVTVI